MARRVAQDMSPAATKDLAASGRALDARGVTDSVVNGLPVGQRGFASAGAKQDLFDQCLEMNRQAMLRSPQPLPGRRA